MVFTSVVVTAALATGVPVVGDAHADEPSTPKVTVVASGLENPRGVKFGPDGRLYVAEGGLGGTTATTGDQCTQVPPPVGPYTGGLNARISRINVHSGQRATVVDGLPSSTTSAAAGSFVSGVADVAFLGNRLYALEAGAGCSHGLANTVNAVLRVDPEKHQVTQVADLSTFLKLHPVLNPDPADFGPDGNWYSLVSAEGLLYAVEPNHQEVDTVSPDGHISRVIDISATYPGATNWQGPTGMVRNGDNFYLVNLNPFAPGSDGHASLWKLTDDGHLTHITSGLTAGLGVAVHDGQVYALEAFTGFFAPAPVPPVSESGMVVRLNRQGSWDPVVTGLSFPTAMTFGADGNLYISNKGFGQPTNTAGEILRVHLTQTEDDK
jgi:hypothetical protein